MAGELQPALRFVNAKGSDVVAALVAGVKELAGGIEVEAARVVPARPFLAQVGQLAVFPDGKDANTVVEAVAPINEPAIGRDEDFRAEIAARKSGWQAGNRLPRCHPALRGIVVKKDDIRALLL